MPDDTTVLTRDGGVTDKHEPKPQQPETEVVLRAKRRTFTAAYKLRILEEADQCTELGEVGALLRREGLYSSNLSLWRRQRQQGQLQGLKPRKRGRKKTEKDAMVQELARLRREKAQLEQRLEKAETIIEVQKKLSTLLGVTLPESTSSDER